MNPKRRFSWVFNQRTYLKRSWTSRDVTVNFSGFKALNALNFSIERGELRVVIGPNGAGKTTLLDCITGKITAHVWQGRLSAG